MAENTDIEVIVTKYLEEGRVYMPAREFITRICLKYPGEQDTPKRERIIMEMVNLVKTRILTRRNKKVWNAWLKEAALQLDSAQVAHRDWINQNIWILKAKPSRNPDPPSPKEKSEEEDILDLEAEEALLESPSKSSKTPMEVDPVVPVIAEGPRRSPRRAAKYSPIKAPSKDEQAESLVQISHEKRASSSAHKQTSTERRGHSIEIPRVSSSGTRQSEPAPSTSSELSITFGKDGERKRYVSMGRGMTVSYPEPAHQEKRSASSSTFTSWKKQKTEDTLLQVRKATEERRSTGKRPNRRQSIKCWVPNCVEPAQYMKVHAFKHHVPEIFHERLQPDDERVLRGRRNALTQAARWLLGRTAPLDELMSFVKIQKLLVSTDRTIVSSVQSEAMQAFCRFLKLAVPNEFELEPINSPGALIHWKVLLLLAASLDADEREYWKTNFPVPEGMVIDGLEEEPAEILPEAYDSHFHLDRTLRELSLPSGSLADILARVPVDQAKRVKLVGEVAVFCDPRTYPSEQSLLDLPVDMKVAVGMHPKHAKLGHRERQEGLEHLFKLLQHPRVTALGEIGLDHTEPMKYWAYQVELLDVILPKLEDRHVLVIHCRGMGGDCGTEVYLLLLHFLRRYVRSRHPIHLHCFTGDQYVLKKWLETFPRTYFGFTNLVDSFTRDQKAALREIEESRLLLESDAPYFPSRGSRVSSPGQLYRVANAVAQRRQSSAEKILEVTVANALCLSDGQNQ